LQQLGRLQKCYETSRTTNAIPKVQSGNIVRYLASAISIRVVIVTPESAQVTTTSSDDVMDGGQVGIVDDSINIKVGVSVGIKAGVSAGL
jgi:hypothetical protein